MIYDILFAVCGVGLIALGLSMVSFARQVDSWKIETVRLIGLHRNLDDKRFEDSCKLARAFQRIQALEEKVKALEETVESLEHKL